MEWIEFIEAELAPAVVQLPCSLGRGSVRKQSKDKECAMAKDAWATLMERILAGRGQGHGDQYRPWLWVRRKNTSAQSNQLVDAIPGMRRECHFLALVEWHMALLCVYLGAADVREQFPLWPQPHLHPLSTLRAAAAQRFEPCRGLMAIADELGIDHGWEVGAPNVPYVFTIDLAVTLRTASGFALAGVSLKPRELLETAEPGARIEQRLRLAAQCMQEYGAAHRIADRRVLGPHTGGVLEFLSAGTKLPAHLRGARLQDEFAKRFVDVALASSIDTGINRSANALRIDLESARLLWLHLAWTRRIEVDITTPLEMGQPLRLGGRAISDALAVELFGVVPECESCVHAERHNAQAMGPRWIAGAAA